jgi:hypothetical protein
MVCAQGIVLARFYPCHAGFVVMYGKCAQAVYGFCTIVRTQVVEQVSRKRSYRIWGHFGIVVVALSGGLRD